MTIADHIRAEEREKTMEFVTYQHTKDLLEIGMDAENIARAFKLPLKKVQDIFQKIKDSSN
jgi:hypothetical protein